MTSFTGMERRGPHPPNAPEVVRVPITRVKVMRAASSRSETWVVDSFVFVFVSFIIITTGNDPP